MSKRVPLLASVGSALEYFDFIIYGMLAPYLSLLFFPEASVHARLMQTFSVFAVGYLARPFGGILLGMLGDCVGRKKAFLVSILLMAIATFSIGILPTFYTMGIIAPLLLILCRIVQGISFGGELPGAITMICESTDAKKRGSYSSFAISSTTIGAILATFFLFLLSNSLPENAIATWGWRIPFLCGGVAAFLLYFLRKKLPESPSFASTHKELKQPLVQLFKEDLPLVFLGSLSMLFTLTLIISHIYLPAYLSAYMGHEKSDIYFAMTLGLIWSALIVPFFGMLGDKIGKLMLFCISAVSFASIGIWLLSMCVTSHLVLFMIVFQTFISASITSFFPILTDLFPAAVRYTGTAICYNMATLLAALSPILMSYLFSLYPKVDLLFYFLAFIALLSFCTSLLSISYKRKRLFSGIDPNN